jgi:membrane-associated phospholipid phosphatase
VAAFHHALVNIFLSCISLIAPLGDLWIVMPAAVALAVWCLVSGERRGALTIVVVTVVSLLMTVILKLIATLIGPPWRDHWDYISSLFPSGHVAMATVVYGALGLCIARAVPRLSVVSVGIIIVMLLLLGTQRVLFNIHPILDVVGGTVLGGAALAALRYLWSSGKLRPVGLPIVAMAMVLIVQVSYGHEVPSSQILADILTQIRTTVDSIKDELSRDSVSSQ